MICKQKDTVKMAFSWSPPLSAADIYIWRDAWKNLALGVGSPGELSEFAGVHHCRKQVMGREEEEVHGNIQKGRPLISLLEWLLPMLPGNWGPQNPLYGKAKPCDTGELPTALAHNPIASVVELQSQDSLSKIFLLPGNQAEERCGLVLLFFLSPSFIWLNPGKRREWLTFWSSAMGSALRTSPCNSQGHRDTAHHPLSPKSLFFTSPDSVKNDFIWFPWTRRWGSPGEPRGGAHTSRLPSGRSCCRQPKKQGGESWPAVSWHTLGNPKYAMGQYIKRAKENNNTSGSSLGYCRGEVQFRPFPGLKVCAMV